MIGTLQIPNFGTWLPSSMRTLGENSADVFFFVEDFFSGSVKHLGGSEIFSVAGEMVLFYNTVILLMVFKESWWL